MLILKWEKNVDSILVCWISTAKKNTSPPILPSLIHTHGKFSEPYLHQCTFTLRSVMIVK